MKEILATNPTCNHLLGSWYMAVTVIGTNRNYIFGQMSLLKMLIFLAYNFYLALNNAFRLIGGCFMVSNVQDQV